jgi:aspartate racemase
MTFQATSIYYDLINQHIRSTLGKRHSAPLILHSFDAEVMLSYAKEGNWPAFSSAMCIAACNLERAGAEAIVITVVLAHRVYDHVAAAVKVPVLHIVDFVADDIKAAGKSRPAVLGARDVMEADYVVGRLAEKHGIHAVVPEADAREEVGRLMIEQVAAGLIMAETKTLFKGIVVDMIQTQGADCLLLGSTDLGFVLQAGDVDVPVFTTAVSHATGVADWALQQ